MCLVGASVLKSRWRVVPSVTLGGGTSSAVLRCGNALTRAVGGGDKAASDFAPGSFISSPLLCLYRTYSATPPPIIAKAGNRNAHHHVLPPGTASKTEIEAIKKPMPIKIFPMALSILGSRSLCLSLCLWRRRPIESKTIPGATSISELAPGNFPDSACGTSAMSAPHPRQNFASSMFCVPHLGQYILQPPKEMMNGKQKVSFFPFIIHRSSFSFFLCRKAS